MQRKKTEFHADLGKMLYSLRITAGFSQADLACVVGVNRSTYSYYVDRAELAVYACPECGGVITDQHKGQMLRLGEWRVVKQNSPHGKRVGFWINTFYSPFVRFADIAKEYFKSRHDPESHQNFINSWMAEPWEDTALKTDADLVLEHQTHVPKLVVPSWAKLLTAGVDVQKTCVYWTIRAWGSYITSQNIAHGQALNLADVEHVMNLQYQREDGGQPMVVNLCIIDSGYDTDMVYDFCSLNSEWAVPGKGASGAMIDHYHISQVNRPTSRAYGMQLVVVNTGLYKDMIAGRMHKKNTDKGSCMVYQGCDREYAEQVTAEHKVNKRSGRKNVLTWEPKNSHGDNHYLDCEVYAAAAADIREVRKLYLEDLAQPPVPPDPAPAPEEEWIKTHENWI